MHALITGGSGRLGRSVVAHLAAAGHAVTVVDVAGAAPSGARLVRADLTDAGAVFDVIGPARRRRPSRGAGHAVGGARARAVRRQRHPCLQRLPGIPRTGVPVVVCASRLCRHPGSKAAARLQGLPVGGGPDSSRRPDAEHERRLRALLDVAGDPGFGAP